MPSLSLSFPPSLPLSHPPSSIQDLNFIRNIQPVGEMLVDVLTGGMANLTHIGSDSLTSILTFDPIPRLINNSDITCTNFDVQSSSINVSLAGMWRYLNMVE